MWRFAPGKPLESQVVPSLGVVRCSPGAGVGRLCPWRWVAGLHSSLSYFVAEDPSVETPFSAIPSGRRQLRLLLPATKNLLRCCARSLWWDCAFRDVQTSLIFRLPGAGLKYRLWLECLKSGAKSHVSSAPIGAVKTLKASLLKLLF